MLRMAEAEISLRHGNWPTPLAATRSPVADEPRRRGAALLHIRYRLDVAATLEVGAGCAPGRPLRTRARDRLRQRDLHARARAAHDRAVRQRRAHEGR